MAPPLMLYCVSWLPRWVHAISCHVLANPQLHAWCAGDAAAEQPCAQTAACSLGVNPSSCCASHLCTAVHKQLSVCNALVKTMNHWVLARKEGRAAVKIIDIWVGRANTSLFPPKVLYNTMLHRLCQLTSAALSNRMALVWVQLHILSVARKSAGRALS